MLAAVRASALLVVVLLVAGCGRFRKAKECDSLAKAVAGWLARQPSPSVGATSSATLIAETRATAKNYEELDKELAALDVQSKELASRVARYRKLAADSARALSDVAHALESNDAELARRRRVDFDAIAKAEAPLVAEINRECQR
jgi:hypothetical protein